MVCAKHKDLPKAKIKKFREARRAKKLAATDHPAAKTRRKIRRTKRAGVIKVRAISKKRAQKAPRKIVPTRAKHDKVVTGKASSPPQGDAARTSQSPATAA